MSTDLKSVELTADVLDIYFFKYFEVCIYHGGLRRGGLPPALPPASTPRMPLIFEDA